MEKRKKHQGQTLTEKSSWEDTMIRSASEEREGLQEKTCPTSTLILGFQSSEKRNICCLGHLVCDIFYETLQTHGELPFWMVLSLIASNSSQCGQYICIDLYLEKDMGTLCRPLELSLAILSSLVRCLKTRAVLVYPRLELCLSQLRMTSRSVFSSPSLCWGLKLPL